ncbi:MAG: PcfJ domain-containing protein [Clostridiaceae bacterium]
MRMNAGVREHLLHFDNKYSPEIMDFATNTALKTSKYMFVTTYKKQQYGYCTHCNTESPTHLPKLSDRAIAEREMCGCPAAMYMGEEYERKKHGEKVICPNCKSECIVRYAGLGHSRLKDYAYFVFYEKSQLNPNMIVARGIHAARDYGSDYKKVKTQLETEVYYTFEYKKMGKMIKPISTSWRDPYHLGFSKTVHCWQHPYTYCYYSRESIKNAVENTPFAWSGWEGYDYKDMLEFFDLYARYPAIEYLNKLGHKQIVTEKLESGHVNYNVINWKGKTIESFFKLTKEEYVIIKQQKLDITSWLLNLIRMNKERDFGLTIQEIAALADNTRNESTILDILKTLGKYMSFREAVKYCLKQSQKRKLYVHSFYMLTRDWQDYVSECKKLNMDTSDMRVLFPNDLYKAHMNTTAQIRYAEDKVLTEKIIARLPELSRFYFKSDLFFIRPAENSFELVEEGKALNHCVGRYAKDYAYGKTCILFIRKAADPDQAFFTVEVNNDQLIQVRGFHNCAPEDKDLIDFIDKFKNEVLPSKKKKQKNKVPA